MCISPTTIRPRPRRQRGSVALVAIMTMVVVLIIALGLLMLGGNVRLAGKRQLRHQGAQTMANAGIEYGYWATDLNGGAVPAAYTRALSSGAFTVSVSDYGSSLSGTIKIVSTGTQNGESDSVTRILPGKTVFDYALCSNKDLNDPEFLTTGSGGAGGDIRSNGKIALGKATVNGNATAVKTIGAFQSITGQTVTGAPALPFPAINTSYYAGIANRTFSGNRTWAGFTFNSPYEVVYVNGDITLTAGTISGTGTLVANGKIHFTGNLAYQFSTDKLAGVATDGIDTGGTGIKVVGLYYTHNSGGDAKATFKKQFGVTWGAVAADTFDIAGPADAPHAFVQDPDMNRVLGKQLHLPGY